MAAVLPSNGIGGGGILGRFAERRPRFAQGLKNNANALTQFGLGLLSGSTRGEGWANAAQGLAYGQQADQAARDRTKAEEEQAARDEARRNLFMSKDFAALSEPERAWFLANPEAADQFLAADIQRRTGPAAAPETTDDITEYDRYAADARARGETPVPFGPEYFASIRQPQTVINNNNGQNGINYGNAPNDYAWARNPDGTVKIDERGAPIALPVGPALAAQQAADAAAAGGAADEGVIADSFVGTIDRAIGLAENADGGLPTTGFIGQLLAGVPMSSQARELANELQTIKSRISLEEINRMRQNSPTGAALGNATNADMTRLESAIVTLDQAVGPVALTDALKRLQDAYLDLVHGPGRWGRDETGTVRVMTGGVSPAAQAAPPPIGGAATDAGPPPAGVTPEEWGVMTPAERALFR